MFLLALSPLSAKSAPIIAYQDMAGKPQNVDFSAATLTLVHFWASWCVPCVAELPSLDQVAGEYEKRGVKVVAISMDATSEKAQEFMARNHIAHLSANLDPQNKLFQALQIHGLPSTVFFNAKGEEVDRISGPFDWKSDEAKKKFATNLDSAR